jgi:hypothetical protein
VQGIPYDGVKADIWSLGVILYVMNSGKRPFTGDTMNILYKNIVSLRYTIPASFSTGFTTTNTELTDLIRKIFVENPTERASMSLLMIDPWVTMDEGVPFQQPPLIRGDISDSTLSRVISSIESRNNTTIFTVRPFELIQPPERKISSKNDPAALRRGRRNSFCGFLSEKNNSVKTRLANTPRESRTDLRDDLKVKDTFNFFNAEDKPVDSSFASPVDSICADYFDTSNIRQNKPEMLSETSGKKGSKLKLELSSDGEKLSEFEYEEESGIKDLPQYSFSRRSSSVRIEEYLARKRASIKEAKSSIDEHSSRATLAEVSKAQSSQATLDSTTLKAKVPKDTLSSLSLKASTVIAMEDSTNIRPKALSKPTLSRIITTRPRSASLTSRPLSSIEPSPLNAHPNSDDCFNGISLDNSIEDPQRESVSRDSDLQKSPNSSTREEWLFARMSTPAHRIVELSMDPYTSPTESELVQWHEIHQVPRKVRTMKVPFGKVLVPHMEPASMFIELHKVLIGINRTSNLRFNRIPQFYLFRCEHIDPYGEPLLFEIEICKVPLIKSLGLRMKRIQGDCFVYQSLYNNIMGKSCWRNQKPIQSS